MNDIVHNNTTLLSEGITSEQQNEAGIFLCLEGDAEIILNDKIFPIKRGTVHIISPLIRCFPIINSKNFKGIYILEKLEVMYPLFRANINTVISMDIITSPCIQLNDKEIDFMIHRKRLIDEKENLLKQSTKNAEKKLIQQMISLLRQETILEMISLYFKNSTVKPHQENKENTFVYNFLSSLNKNYMNERTVKYYSDSAKLSAGRFTTIIRNATGKTPSEWIVFVTILNAKVMLEKTDKRIKEIAASLNFPEQFTFRKYFKRYVGISPRQYRKLHSTKKSDDKA